MSVFLDCNFMSNFKTTYDNMSIINRCVELCNVDSTVEDYFISLKNEFPEKEQILSIYEPIIEGLQTANPVEDNGEYVTLIMSVIDNSSVQQSIKEDLNSGLTIANASARLWNTETIEKQIKELKPDVTEKINLSLEEIFMQEMKGEDYDYKSILN